MRTGVFHSVDVNRLKSITRGKVGRFDIGGIEVIKEQCNSRGWRDLAPTRFNVRQSGACATRPRHTSADDCPSSWRCGPSIDVVGRGLLRGARSKLT